jgi:hypothetical protein
LAAAEKAGPKAGSGNQHGGGGGGAYAKKVLTVTPGLSYSVTVGSGSTTTSRRRLMVFQTTVSPCKGGNSVPDNTTTGASGALSLNCSETPGGNGNQ